MRLSTFGRWIWRARDGDEVLNCLGRREGALKYSGRGTRRAEAREARLGESGFIVLGVELRCDQSISLI